MAKTSESTREKLIRSATYLMARRGLDVPFADIQEHAGQRNSSAVQYHFGGRRELILAVVERHAASASEMEAVRSDLLARRDDPRSFVEAIVTRLCLMLETPERRDFLRFSHQLMMWTPHRRRLAENVDDPHLASMQAEMEMLHEVMPELPDRIVRERAVAGLEFVILQVAERARIIDDDEIQGPMLAEGEFVDNLIDMTTGMLTAPLSGEGAQRPRLLNRLREVNGRRAEEPARR